MVRLVWALVLCVGLGQAAQARENYAILIGASTYPNLAERYWLVGPANDVDLVRQYLVSNPAVPFVGENITLLADGVEGGTPPTLAAIRQAMADLAGRLQPGDFVYLHFSGHGSQSPAVDPDSELDGLDELFLPVDIGPWDDSVGQVQNALVDDEIGEMIGALRATGASVWAVFDSCHSGTVTRAAPGGSDDVRLRKLEPSALGIPDGAMQAVQSRALAPREQAASPVDAVVGSGSFVAFFAAQTNETTPEKRLPRGLPERRSQGVFTYTLFEALASRPGLTYRQLGQEVLRRYAVENLARSTPLFEGDLDTPVFAGEGAAAVRQWPLTVEGDVLSMPAGRLHGVVEGAVLAILGSPVDTLEQALGFVEVASAGAFEAEIVPVAHAGRYAPVVDELPRGAYLRKLSESLDFGLTVAMPEVGSVPAEQLADAMMIALENELLGARTRIVEAGAEADLRLAVLPDSPRPAAIWVLPATGLVDEADLAATPSVDTEGKTPGELADVLADTLTRIGRVQNLLKLGGVYGGGALDVEVQLQTRSPDLPLLRDLAAIPVPRLVPDDEVHVLAQNNEATPVDLNVLYVGSDFSITHMFSGRLQPGDRLKQGLLRITDEAFGRDRVILLLSPAAPQSAVEDLSFLEQSEMSFTRAAGEPTFADNLAEAGFGVTTRAAKPLGGGAQPGPKPEILQIDLDTLPGN